jgi:SAM-dependent methyltransferase
MRAPGLKARSPPVRAAENPYDAVAYPSFPFPNTHPSNLAAMAILHGLSPAPVDRCRVLEIACNEGGNLIPMAYAIPGSEFVGFDLARLPVERGQARVRDLGLKNIRLFVSDLLEVGAELGQFDYIITHGLYAWAPEAVRNRLLALCGELLTPDGVVFISYNALPGGYVRNIVREMLIDRVNGSEDLDRRSDDLDRRLSDALGLVRLLVESRPERDPFRMLIESHLKQMQERGAQSTFHDELGEAYHPVHFIEFAQHARWHGLQYLSEAVLPPPPDPCYREEIRAALEKAAPGDILRQEQMLDFARARKYRETLLCRADRVVRRDYPAEHLGRLMFASRATSSAGAKAGATVFTLPGGIKMESNHPAAVGLMGELERAWPRALGLEELESRLAGTGFALHADGAGLLTKLAVSKFIELRAWSAPVAAEISMRPRASAYSRLEARSCPHATTLLHSLINLDDPVSRGFLALLDGTRDRGEIAAALRAQFPKATPEELEGRVEPNLEFLYRAGFLEA